MAYESLGLAVNPSGTFTRPNDTTAYASGDLVADSTVAGTASATAIKVARSNDRGGIIPRVRLVKTDPGVTGAAFRLHAFALPASAALAFVNGDNGAFSCNKAANYLGAYDVASMQAFSDGAAGIGTPVNGNAIIFGGPRRDDMKIHWVVEARGAYTPAAQEQFTIIPEVIQD